MESMSKRRVFSGAGAVFENSTVVPSARLAMCGIAGEFIFDPQGRVDESNIVPMVSAIRHTETARSVQVVERYQIVFGELTSLPKRHFSAHAERWRGGA
jgi:hypothetical protein